MLNAPTHALEEQIRLPSMIIPSIPVNSHPDYFTPTRQLKKKGGLCAKSILGNLGFYQEQKGPETENWYKRIQERRHLEFFLI